MSSKKKQKSITLPSSAQERLSDVDVALALSFIDQELARLGVSTTATHLPSYGYDDLELQRTRLFPDVEHKLYFSSNDLVQLGKKENDVQFDSGMTAADESDTANEEQKRLKKIMEKSKLKDLDIEKQATVPIPKSKSEIQRLNREKRGETAGPGWYDLKTPTLTPELQQDLKVVQLRAFTDPKKFFKRQKSEAPKHFEVGKLVASPVDFYSEGRNKAKMTKAHFADALLEDQDYKKYAKKRYRDIQNSKTGAKPKHFNKKRKGDNVQDKRPFKKPKKF